MSSMNLFDQNSSVDWMKGLDDLSKGNPWGGTGQSASARSGLSGYYTGDPSKSQRSSMAQQAAAVAEQNRVKPYMAPKIPGTEQTNLKDYILEKSGLGGLGAFSGGASYADVNKANPIPLEEQARIEQLRAADRLSDILTGKSSMVDKWVDQEMQRASEEAQALAINASAYNPGLAGMMAQQAMGNARMKISQQAAIAREQEQSRAAEQLTSLFGQMRQQDVQLFMADLQAALERENIAQRDRSVKEQTDAERRGQDIDLYGRIIGGGVQGIGEAVAASDERLKKNIIDESEGIDEFLRHINPSGYNYKDKKHGGGYYVSPMAQELEKSRIGKTMVVDTPEGKMVDYGRGFGAILASQARIAKRLDSLESDK